MSSLFPATCSRQFVWAPRGSECNLFILSVHSVPGIHRESSQDWGNAASRLSRKREDYKSDWSCVMTALLLWFHTMRREKFITMLWVFQFGLFKGPVCRIWWHLEVRFDMSSPRLRENKDGSITTVKIIIQQQQLLIQTHQKENRIEPCRGITSLVCNCSQLGKRK